MAENSNTGGAPAKGRGLMGRIFRRGQDLSGSALYKRLVDIGIALSLERDLDALMETILLEAKEITNADGGTVYLRTPDDKLKFQIVRTDSLDIAMGGTSGNQVNFPAVPMYDAENGEPNYGNVASYVALTGGTVNIVDAYETATFDFTGTRKFDERTGYRSKSFLTVPLKNNQDEIIGVLQLLNAIDVKSGNVAPFPARIQPPVEALASQAAIALDNAQLLEGQRNLMNSFIKLLATAIDAKSPYTGGHCQRVPALAELLTQAACRTSDGPFADFDLNEEEWRELQIATWLHDCGKVTTPEYVVDKATKLETIHDRIHEIRMRFEIVKLEREIEFLKAAAVAEGAGGDKAALRANLDADFAKLDDDFAFIAESNIGGEFMAPERIERVKEIAEIQWTRTLDDRLGISRAELARKEATCGPPPKLPVREPILADRPDHIIARGDTARHLEEGNPHGFNVKAPEHMYNMGEVYNLSIGRGTLTKEERFKINDHMAQTIVMLEELPFPKALARVPEYAGGHHEKMNGGGYPKGLRKEEMSVPARIMAIADIFEALTAADRPYKPPKTLSESIKIMSFMAKDEHIDHELFELFLTSGVYRDYAARFLEHGQIDEVNINDFLPAQAAE
ncbi:MAG: HD domain-containing phosphohydrolase [Rhodospirillales bacterium]